MAPYGGIELGGTKCVLAVGDGSDQAWISTVIPTTDPATTIEMAIDWFREAEQRSGSLSSLGVACFGPLDRETGAIAQATPKTQWRGFPVRAELERALGAPVKLDTDVNGAALAESAWGAAQGCADMLYVTIGTGIGVGAIVNRTVVHGQSHPEMGHMRIPQHPTDRQPDAPEQLWTGNCVFHGNCWEGLASGPAKARRSALWEQALEEPPDADLLEGEYIALGLANLISAYRPQRVVLGGGVMHDVSLMSRIRERIRQLLGDYLPETNCMDELVVGPALGDAAGVVGAILLAAELRPGHLRTRSATGLTDQIQAAQGPDQIAP